MKKRFTILVAAIAAIMLITQPFTVMGQVVSGTTYSITSNSTNSLPTNWSGVQSHNTSATYYLLTYSTSYIQTSNFVQYGFSSIKLKARKYGGPSDSQLEISVSWYNVDTKAETVLGTISPSSTTLSNYTISSPASVSAGNGYIKIQCKNASGGKGSGVSEVTITYKSCTPSTSTLAFGEVEIGDSDEKSFTLTTAGLTSNLTLSTGVGSIYSVSPTSINKSATSTTVTVTCTPTVEGTSNGTLTISGGGLSANVTVALTATGVPASSDPTCTVEPDIYDFGSVAVNGTKSHSFTVTTANLTDDLALSMSSDKYTVEPNEIDKDATSTEVTITFAPTEIGDVDADLLINGSGFVNELVATLSGTGVTPYDVTLDPGTGSVSSTTWNITMNNGNLPAASPSDACASNGWTFYGWSTAEVSETTTTPTTIVPTAYVPTSAITLYAVYKEGQAPFDNTASGKWTIYATITTSKTTTNYYATSISSNKLQSSTTSSDATEFSFVKKEGTGNYAIKMGSKYLCHSGSDDTNVGVQDDEYVWTISGGTNGIWHVAAASYSRALIFRASTYNVFGGYKNVNNTEYFDVKIGVKSPITYNSNPECLEKLDTPTFTVDAGEYDEIQTVEIEYVEGATVYYTTDGTTPSAQNGTVYTSALTIDGTTTVKAIAVKDGYDDSDVAEATYTITTLYTMQAIYNKALAIGGTASNVKVKFNNWVVSGVGTDNKTVYVTDNAGKGFIIYTSSHGFAVNDILSGTVNSTPLKIYAGAAEFTNLTTDDLTVTHNGSITPLSKTISELGGVNTGAAVTISNLSYNGTNLSDGDNNISPYNMLYATSLFTSGHDYSSVTGVYVHYNSTKQIAPRAAADVVEVEYGITVNQPAEHGTIGVSGNKTSAKYEEAVTLTSEPEEGYAASWIVMNGSTPIEVTNNQFTMPKGAVTVTATFVIPQIFTLTFDVNGNTSLISPVNVTEGNSIDLTDNAYKPSLAGYTFKGWSETNGSATTIASPSTYMPNASKTLYAVFKLDGGGSFTLDKDSGFPSTYASAQTITLAGHSFSVADVGTSYNDNIQIRKSSGSIYNKENFGKITEIKIAGTYTNTVIEFGTSENPTGGSTVTPSSGTYDVSSYNYTHFVITSSDGASNLTSIKITYENTSDVVFVNSACTKAGIASGEIVNVGANGILTLTGANAGNASNLIIEDGGQIITSRTDVKATFKKTIDATTKASNWNTISSPIGRKEISTVPNLVSGEGLSYNLYRYNETVATNQWEAYNLDNTSPSYHSDFTHLEKGHGYLYRNNGPDIEYAGTVNTEDVDLTLTASASALTNLKGFNLIGNPFGQNITMSNISGVSLSGGYVLSNAGGWSPDPVATIHPCEGFLVQVAEEADITISLGTKGTTYNKEYIKFMVSNSQYEDAAFALFDDSYGLNKIEHRNPEIPMLYINKDNRDLAIATMSDNTKSFNLNFKAMTTGMYTLRYDSEGEYNYLHIIDRLTGADVDMLLEGEYSFIGTPNDNENRFIVNLEYMPNYSEGNNEIFAFQSGDEILVSGSGELQIFDVTGRSVMTTTINGAESINLSAKGVYIFRLVGSEIKTHKIVVR